MTKHCFVVQGFGKKQDYAQGKQFDLDASYEVIKEAIENAGIECYRADELRTSGSIEQVMYDQLLTADLVVADITTLNFNAAYELGVRLALRPYSTLIVGEKGMNFPFDINHIYIHTYQHLGEDIGNREARRFRKELTQLAKKIVNTPQNDSPIYTFLQHLPKNGFIEKAEKSPNLTTETKRNATSLRDLKVQAQKAMDNDQFSEAIDLWEKAREHSGKDDYIVQQLALATYKSKQPDQQQALLKAIEVLEYLQPRSSFDSETLGLWAAVHKQLFEKTQKSESLEEALFALERGFFLRYDYYNGINLAFMLNTKAAISDEKTKQDLRAVARYVYRKVKNICTEKLIGQDLSKNEKYWITATLYETCIGLGQVDEAQLWEKKLETTEKAMWMEATTKNQITKLQRLLSS